MVASLSYVDPKRTYVSNVIPRSGRNEVQIFPINSTSSQEIVVQSLVKNYELPAEHEFKAACWVCPESASSRRSSKRTRGDDTQDHEESELFFVVLTTSDTILVFSPVKDTVISQFSVNMHIIDICGSLTENTVLAIAEDRQIVEISLTETKIVKTHSFKNDLSIQKIHSVHHNGGRSTVIVASADLYLVDLARSKKPVLIEFPKHSSKNKISFIKQSLQKIYIARENSSEVCVYDLANPDSFSSLATSSPVLNIQTATFKGQEVVLAFTVEGVKVFHEDLVCEITNDGPAELCFTNGFLKSDQFVCIWHKLNQIHFAATKARFESVKLAIKSSTQVEVEEDQPEFDVTIDIDTTEIDNISSDKLSKKLIKLLESKKKSDKIIALCSSNDNEDLIKDTIQYISTEENSEVLIPKLFSEISHKVSQSPSVTSSLSIWLKWILVVQGGLLSKQPEQYENLKALQKGLNDGMKLVPKLLALQGRLQLLKSQAELRSRMESVEYEEDEDFTEYTVNESVAEESIVYANGENDELDDSVRYDEKEDEDDEDEE